MHTQDAQQEGYTAAKTFVTSQTPPCMTYLQKPQFVFTREVELLGSIPFRLLRRDKLCVVSELIFFVT